MSLSRPLRYRLEYLAFRALAALAAALPLDRASALSGWLWRRLGPFTSRHKRALANVALSLPEKSEAERRAIVAGMWENLGRTFAESFHLKEIIETRVAYPPDAELADAATRAPGSIWCSLHLANWEIVIALATKLGVAPAGVYQRLTNPLVDAHVTQMRGWLYPAGLFSKGVSTPMALMRVARQGGAVALLADQRDKRGVEVDFFGRPAPTTPFPAMMAVGLKKPLFACHVTRLGGAHFAIAFEEVPVTRTGDREADVLATTQTLQGMLERYIRTAPEQWMWVHRRWG